MLDKHRPSNVSGVAFASRLKSASSVVRRGSRTASSTRVATAAGRPEASTRNISCSAPMRRVAASKEAPLSSMCSSARTSSRSARVNARDSSSSRGSATSCLPISG
ncbi:MAG: hypothetical protein M5U28_35760 [Sandaracinaceae bacterium]|nr:hypothetical protein [Sandaracinaceae bacterium]